MKRTKFAEMLESERKRLRYSQTTTGKFLCMSQPAYSRMEGGLTNPGVERSLEIIKILEKHGFIGLQPIELEELDQVPTIKIRWPWNKWVLYGLITVLFLMAIDFVARGPAEFAEGLLDAKSGKPDPDAPTGLMYLAFVGIAIVYGIYRLIKKWRR